MYEYGRTCVRHRLRLQLRMHMLDDKRLRRKSDAEGEMPNPIAKRAARRAELGGDAGEVANAASRFVACLPSVLLPHTPVRFGDIDVEVDTLHELLQQE